MKYKHVLLDGMIHIYNGFIAKVANLIILTDTGRSASSFPPIDVHPWGMEKENITMTHICRKGLSLYSTVLLSWSTQVCLCGPTKPPRSQVSTMTTSRLQRQQNEDDIKIFESWEDGRE